MPGLEGHVRNCEMKLSSEAEGGWLRAGAGLEHVGGGCGQVLGTAVERVTLKMQKSYLRPLSRNLLWGWVPEVCILDTLPG